jgi:hypothetical protein
MWKADEVLHLMDDDGKWTPSILTVAELEADAEVIECDADGNPLDAKPAPLTLADLEAFEARLRVNLEALRTP